MHRIVRSPVAWEKNVEGLGRDFNMKILPVRNWKGPLRSGGEAEEALNRSGRTLKKGRKSEYWRV